MSAKLLEGKGYAEYIRQVVMEDYKGEIRPCIHIISIEPDEASTVYVSQKIKAAEKWGIRVVWDVFTSDYSEDTIISHIERLGMEDAVHGIIVQLPVPPEFDSNALIDAINPDKDIDGLTAPSVGELSRYGFALYEPCTASGIMYMLSEAEIPMAGKHVVIIGRSMLVGKPLVPMLLHHDATVTVCHSKTENLEAYTKTADILISATGVPSLITKDMVKPGACVIDVGISRVNGKIVGDVDFENVKEVAGWITPVPGGVGPMTVAMLMNNTYIARNMCINS